MEKKIIISIPFNTMYHKLNPACLEKEWIDYRINIFMNYTATSLINQTNQSFICIVAYDENTKDLVFDALSKYPPLPSNIVFTSNGHKIIRNYIEGGDYVYQIRLDSDNMYSPDFIEKIYSYPYHQGLQCILAQSGYVYDTTTENLATWYYVSPPFYALIYSIENYVNNFRYQLLSGHASAINLNYEVLPGRNFIVTVHGKNTLTKFRSSFVQEYITDNTLKNSILDELMIRRGSNLYKLNS